MNRSPHQILSHDAQEELDKKSLELLLRTHNLDENVDLVYNLVKACCGSGGQIDECIERIIAEYNSISKIPDGDPIEAMLTNLYPENEKS